MKLNHDIFLEQQQKLLMTPELRQAIAILQMSTLELNDFISQEIEKNPFLEEREPEEPDEEKPVESDQEKLDDWLEIYNDRDIGFEKYSPQDETSFENFFASRPSLFQHLEFQLHLEIREPEEMRIGQFIIGSLDSNGYLTMGLDEIAQRVDADTDTVEKVLKVIQTFHPAGVAARNLAECLLLQLQAYGKQNPLAEAIIENHLDDLARGRLHKIAQTLSISVYEAQDICDMIKSLDPRPGLQYSDNNDIKYIIPDILVEKIEGEYIVIVNDLHLPRLTVSQLYENILRQPEMFSPEARKYMQDKMESAVWLIKSIEQRRMTLYRVARCIVDIQRDFLDKGVKHLKPITLKDVADIIQVHESTVSRATTNKYVQTPQGLFELKYFFSTGVVSYGTENKVSSKSIKYMIDEIIKSEDPTRPLSDKAIAELIEKKGIKISRRTVAKYRQEMGIASTITRKRYINT
jgi:RNA polymerase sigma-54 factor